MSKELGIQQAVNLDANEKVIFERSLEVVKTKTYDIKYPAFKAKQFIPVSTEAGAGAKTIVYQQYDTVGMMKIISSYADDLPRSDIKGKEFSVQVRSVGGSYGYDINEVRYAVKAGLPLDAKKAGATRKSYETIVNKIAWFAKADDPKYAGMTGLLYNANIPSATVANNAGATSTLWINKTPDEIIKDVNKVINDIAIVTKGVEIANTLILPLSQYTYISTTRVDATDSMTILKFLKEAHPEVSFEWATELEAVSPLPSTGTGSGNVMIAYRRDPEVLTLELPQEYEQFPAQERGLEFVVPAHGRIAGVIVYYPLAINIAEGI